MDQPDFEAPPQFSRPRSQERAMLCVLGMVGVMAVLGMPRVLPVFLSNPYLNGFILFVFALGVITCLWQVWQLRTLVRWIEGFASGTDQGATPPQLLAPLATLLRNRSKRLQMTTGSARSILESVAQRIDEGREITRYIVNLLIFLGLLGTFYGLATTVPALVETIRGLAPEEGESGTEVFARLMNGLDSQLTGMGVAFASSLLGLAGSLVVGLLEVFAGRGQNRFYRELEEWLSSMTKLSFSSGESEGDGVGAGLGGSAMILDTMADQMEALQNMFARSDETRAEVDARLSQLAGAVERMTERIEATSPSASALMRIAEGQERLADAIMTREASEGIDAESRMRLRSIDVQMLRILEEISAGRQESMAELRTELATLVRTLQQMQRTPRPAAPGQPATVQPQRPIRATGGGAKEE